MKIDIDKLTESELIDLNNRIVARLNFLFKTDCVSSKRFKCIMVRWRSGFRSYRIA